MARRHLLDLLHERLVAEGELVADVLGDRLVVELGRLRHRVEDGPDQRRHAEDVLRAPVVERLHAELIADQEQSTLGLVVDDEGPESVEVGKDPAAPAGPGVEQHLGVVGGRHRDALRPQSRRDRVEVEDLAVVGEHVGRALERLGSAIVEPDDGQTRVTDLHRPIRPEPDVVGSAPPQGPEQAMVKRPIDAGDREDAAHIAGVTRPDRTPCGHRP